jgi:hypothetical protein
MNQSFGMSKGGELSKNDQLFIPGKSPPLEVTKRRGRGESVNL